MDPATKAGVFLTVCLIFFHHAHAIKVRTQVCADQGERDAWAHELATQLVGSGVAVSNAAIVGECEQFGLFKGGNSITQTLNDEGNSKETFIKEGLVISNGEALAAGAENNNGGSMGRKMATCNKTSGEIHNDLVPDLYKHACEPNPDCETLCDAAQLTFEFDIVGSENLNVSMNYIFASEEYNSFVGTRYADCFAFLLDGENIALAGDGQPVSISTINGGNGDPNFGPDVPASNLDQFVDNDSRDDADEFKPPEAMAIAARGLYKTQFDGFTTQLRAGPVPLCALGSHTMRFALADAGDASLDTAVFIQSKSFSTLTVGCMNQNALNFDPLAQKDSGQCQFQGIVEVVFGASDPTGAVVCEPLQIQWYDDSETLNFDSSVTVEICGDTCVSIGTFPAADVSCDPSTHLCDGPTFTPTTADLGQRYIKLTASYSANADNSDPAATQANREAQTALFDITTPSPMNFVFPNEDNTCGGTVLYLGCPVTASFTSTEELAYSLDVCPAGSDVDCLEDISQGDILSGSYTSLELSITDGLVAGEEYAFHLSSTCFAEVVSSAATVKQYGAEALVVTAPAGGAALYGCGAYEIRWDVTLEGLFARTSRYDVHLINSDTGAVARTIATDVVSGNTMFTVPDEASLAAGAYTIEVSSSDYADLCIPKASVAVTVAHYGPSDLEFVPPTGALVCGAVDVYWTKPVDMATASVYVCETDTLCDSAPVLTVVKDSALVLKSFDPTTLTSDSYFLHLVPQAGFEQCLSGDSQEITMADKSAAVISLVAPATSGDDVWRPCLSYDISWIFPGTDGGSTTVELLHGGEMVKAVVAAREGTAVAIKHLFKPGNWTEMPEDGDAIKVRAVDASDGANGGCVESTSATVTFKPWSDSSIRIIDAGKDESASMPGTQWRKCHTYYLDVGFENDISALDVSLTSAASGTSFNVQYFVTSSGLVQYTVPSSLPSGEYSVVAQASSMSVTDLSLCVPSASYTVDIIDSAIQNVTAEDDVWSEMCVSEGVDYLMTWASPELQYVSVLLCKDDAANSSMTRQCVALQTELPAEEWTAEQMMFSTDLFQKYGDGAYIIQVDPAQDESCIASGYLNISLISGRDDSKCPAVAAATGLDALSTGEQAGIGITAILIFLAVVLVIGFFAKRQIDASHAAAGKAVAAAQAEMDEEKMRDKIELTHLDAAPIMSIDEGSAAGGASAAEMQQLEDQVARLKLEVARLKRSKYKAPGTDLDDPMPAGTTRNMAFQQDLMDD